VGQRHAQVIQEGSAVLRNHETLVDLGLERHRLALHHQAEGERRARQHAFVRLERQGVLAQLDELRVPGERVAHSPVRSPCALRASSRTSSRAASGSGSSISSKPASAGGDGSCGERLGELERLLERRGERADRLQLAHQQPEASRDQLGQSDHKLREERRVALHEVEQPGAAQAAEAARGAGAHVVGARRSVDEAHFPHDAARPDARQAHALPHRLLEDLELAVLDQQEAVGGISLAERRFSRGEACRTPSRPAAARARRRSDSAPDRRRGRSATSSRPEQPP
jgi:hypothetical protein